MLILGSSRVSRQYSGRRGTPVRVLFAPKYRCKLSQADLLVVRAGCFAFRAAGPGTMAERPSFSGFGRVSCRCFRMGEVVLVD